MSGVVYSEGSWTQPSSQRAFSYRLWHPPRVGAVLIVVHGFGEHSGRYESFARSLAEQSIFVAAPDLWGHGRSGGARGDLGSIADCVQDLWTLTEAVFLPRSGRTAYAVFGHSFGGLVAVQWALRSPSNLQRAVIQSPLIEEAFQIPRWKKAAAAVLASVWPTAPFSMNLDAEALSRDPLIVQAYRTDPLVHNRITARTYRSIVQARDDAFARAPVLRTPVLFLCGTEDRIVSVAAAQRWFDRLAGEKRRVIFSGCYHELHHEAVRDDVLRLVRGWTLEAATAHEST